MNIQRAFPAFLTRWRRAWSADGWVASNSRNSSSAVSSAPPIRPSAAACSWTSSYSRTSSGVSGEPGVGTALPLRQAEHALADDVALDLAGPAGDRVLPRTHHPVRPARGVGDRFGRAVDGRVGAEKGRRGVGDALRQLGAEQLEDRAFRSRRLAAQAPAEAPESRHLERLRVDRELGDHLADMGLVPGRLLTVRERLGDLDEAGDLRGMVAAAGAPALEHQRRDRDLPALVDLADHVLLRNLDVLEEDLVEMPMPVEEHQRAHGDARRLHVDEQVGDAVVLWRVGVGADQQEATIGEMCARGPHLLAVDDEMVALVDRPGPEAGKVAAGAGLGEALAPALVPGEDRGQVALLLRFGAELDQRRPQQPDRAVPGEDRRVRPEILLVEDHLLDKAGAAPAVFLGPGDADPAGGVHLLLPGDALFERLPVGRDARIRCVLNLQIVGQIGLEPGAEFAAKFGVLGGVGEIHRLNSLGA